MVPLMVTFIFGMLGFVLAALIYSKVSRLIGKRKLRYRPISSMKPDTE